MVEVLLSGHCLEIVVEVVHRSRYRFMGLERMTRDEDDKHGAENGGQFLKLENTPRT
jgi:hypothetical protein